MHNPTNWRVGLPAIPAFQQSCRLRRAEAAVHCSLHDTHNALTGVAVRHFAHRTQHSGRAVDICCEHAHRAYEQHTLHAQFQAQTAMLE